MIDEDKLFNKLMKMKKEDLASYMVGMLSCIDEKEVNKEFNL